MRATAIMLLRILLLTMGTTFVADAVVHDGAGWTGYIGGGALTAYVMCGRAQ